MKDDILTAVKEDPIIAPLPSRLSFCLSPGRQTPKNPPINDVTTEAAGHQIEEERICVCEHGVDASGSVKSGRDNSSPSASNRSQWATFEIGAQFFILFRFAFAHLCLFRQRLPH